MSGATTATQASLGSAWVATIPPRNDLEMTLLSPHFRHNSAAIWVHNACIIEAYPAMPTKIQNRLHG